MASVHISSVVEQEADRYAFLKFLASQLGKSIYAREFEAWPGGTDAGGVGVVGGVCGRVRATDGILEDSGGPEEEVRCLRAVLNRQETKSRY
jgi:hypothetical protein